MSEIRHLRCLLLAAPISLVLSMTAAASAVAQAPARDVRPQGTAAGRALQLPDYYRIETVGSSAISPDGKRVAFVRTFIVEADNRRQSELWLAPTDGSAPPMRIASPAFAASEPRWSPDGALLSFTSRRRAVSSARDSASADGEGTTWFLRMDAASGEAFQIPGVSTAPNFSPDGQWIALVKRAPAKPRVYASELDRKIAERFKGKAYDWMGARFDQRGYLPDPRDSLALPPVELYVVPRAGGTPRRLTQLGVDVQEAVWSPDSKSLAVVANTHQRDEYTYERADLFVVNFDGQLRRLTDDEYDNDSPAWTPDGKTLVFRRQLGLSTVIAAKQAHGAPVDLYRMPAAGGAMQPLTPKWDLLPGAPQLDASGRFIYFDAENGGDRDLFRLPVSGGDVEIVTRGGRRLGGFSISWTAGRMAFTATDPSHPTELFTAGIDGAGERRLTSFNDAFIAEVGLSSAQRIVYPSKDGTRIEGWVLLPRGYDAATRTRYPMILAMHGGPHGAYGNNFDFEFQLFAANGYAVLYTNPRGSTGYGENFLWATWGGGWGNKDMEDVMAGVDYAIAHYPIDPKRLGATGYSYGGFLTNWVITHTTRFSAAIAGAGITNWVSDYGTADIPRTKESEFFGAPWEPKGYELLWRQSPIAYAGNVTTPTMFIHGEADLRVPIEQAEQMYTALKKRKVPARMVRYPDSYHGGWSPWNSVHRYHQEMQWWDQWLAAPRM